MKKLLLSTILLVIGIFLWWTISPLFIEKTADDELPQTVVEELKSSDTIGSEDFTSSLRGPYPIEDTRLHPATGEVLVIESSSESIIRYTNYEGTNGPDLYVYLAKDLEAREFVNLGPARGNKGNLNYSVPADVNLNDYPYVMTWCKAFGVLFDYAEIN